MLNVIVSSDKTNDQVLTHGTYGEYGHPQHVELSLLITSYLRLKRRLKTLHYFLPFPLDRGLQFDAQIDQYDARVNAIKVYTSQFAAWTLSRVDSILKLGIYSDVFLILQQRHFIGLAIGWSNINLVMFCTRRQTFSFVHRFGCRFVARIVFGQGAYQNRMRRILTHNSFW